jgi:UDP-2,3-diacylglucosamine hydrolase
MNPEMLFVSDLHLSAVRPDAVGCFLRFLAERAPGAQALYVLGDLFDAYIGDDDERFPNRDIKAGLRQLAAGGTRVYFQHGNRDFLVGDRFCRDAGAQLLGDYAVVDLFGTPTLVTHGDLLCTDDVQYQQARERVRSDAWKQNALAKPLFARRLYARWYRYRSGRDKGAKTAEIMDVNPGAVVSAMNGFGVSRLIHGHTHRPAVHDLDLAGSPAQRFVLAEWLEEGQVLVWSPDGYRLEVVPRCLG